MRQRGSWGGKSNSEFLYAAGIRRCFGDMLRCLFLRHNFCRRLFRYGFLDYLSRRCSICAGADEQQGKNQENGEKHHQAQV